MNNKEIVKFSVGVWGLESGQLRFPLIPYKYPKEKLVAVIHFYITLWLRKFPKVALLPSIVSRKQYFNDFVYKKRVQNFKVKDNWRIC